MERMPEFEEPAQWGKIYVNQFLSKNARESQGALVETLWKELLSFDALTPAAFTIYTEGLAKILDDGKLEEGVIKNTLMTAGWNTMFGGRPIRNFAIVFAKSGALKVKRFPHELLQDIPLALAALPGLTILERAPIWTAITLHGSSLTRFRGTWRQCFRICLHRLGPLLQRIERGDRDDRVLFVMLHEMLLNNRNTEELKKHPQTEKPFIPSPNLHRILHMGSFCQKAHIAFGGIL